MSRSRARRRFALSLALALALPLAALASDPAGSPAAPVPAEVAPAKPALFARTLVLVRHGQYLEDPAADERLGPGLSSLGIAQSRLAGARLAAQPARFDAVFASPMTRARDTARVIAEDLHLPVRIADELAECTPPTWRKAAVADERPEDLAACAKTLDRVFAERFRPAEGAERRELIVAHGNVIRYLVTKVLQVDTQAWLEMSVDHASLTTVLVAPDGTMKLLGVGDSGHLPFNLQTRASGDPGRSLVVPPEPPPN